MENLNEYTHYIYLNLKKKHYLKENSVCLIGVITILYLLYEMVGKIIKKFHATGIKKSRSRYAGNDTGGMTQPGLGRSSRATASHANYQERAKEAHASSIRVARAS